MRFHIRRLVLLALGFTSVVLVLLNVLRSHDVDLTVPQIQVEQRPLRPVSLDERLAKYIPGSGGNGTALEQAAVYRPDVVPLTVRRRSSEQHQSKTHHESDGEVYDVTVGDDLMSSSVSGSQNELIRLRYVHLPEQSKFGFKTIWWSNSSDASPDDRIQVQMKYVPRKYDGDGQKLKIIYMPGGLGNEPEGQEKFITEKCPVNTCKLTSDRSVAVTAEMRLLQADAFFHSTKKPAGQIWTMFLLESPANTGEFVDARDLINWTATYRWDSTLVTPYEKFVPYRNRSRLHKPLAGRRRRSPVNTTLRNYAAGKTKMVAWFVSNCGPKNKRNEYAKELARYIRVIVLIPSLSAAGGIIRSMVSISSAREMVNKCDLCLLISPFTQALQI